MSALAVEPREDATLVPMTVAGRIRVRERVLEKVIREASAVTIGVPRDEVNVELSEWDGGLNVRIASRMRIPDLTQHDAIAARPTILDQINEMQSTLAAEFSRLTGRHIRRVSFTITGAIIPERKRVR